MIRTLFILLNLFVLFLNINLSAWPARAGLSETDQAAIASYNQLMNPGWENDVQGWTYTGGTATVTTSSPMFGLAHATWDSNAATQTYCSRQTTIPAGLALANGEASIFISVPSGTPTHKLMVVDGSANVLSESTINVPATSSHSAKTSISFLYPASGTVSMCLYSVASNEPSISFDAGFVGPSRDIGTVAQARYLGSALHAGTTNCNWTMTATTTPTSFGADAQCPTPTVTGGVSAPSTLIPGATIAKVPGPGVIKLTATGEFLMGGNICNYRFYDGTTGSDNINGMQSSGTNSGPSVVGYFRYTTAQTNKTYDIQAFSRTSTTTCGIFAGTATVTNLKIDVEYFPDNNSTVYTTEQSDFSDVDCGALSIGATTTPPTKASGINIDKQWCSRTGNKLTVRVEYSQSNATSAAIGSGDYLFLVPMSLSIDTTKATAYATVEGGSSNFQSRGSVGSGTVGFASDNGVMSVYVYDATRVRFCGVTPSTAGCVGSAYFHTNDTATHYAFTYTVPIATWTTTNRAPQLINTVISPYEGVVRELWGDINCDAGSSILSERLGDAYSGVTNVSAGACTTTFTTPFAAAPYCEVDTITATDPSVNLSIVSTSTTTVVVDCDNSAAGGDCTSYDYVLHCSGAK